MALDSTCTDLVVTETVNTCTDLVVTETVNAREWAQNAANLHRNFMGAVHTAVVQYLSGNTTNLGILLAVTHGIPNGLVPVTDKARMEFAAPLKRILSHTLPELEYKRDKTKKVGLKIAMGAAPDGDKLASLRKFAEDFTNYKSDKVKECFPAAVRKVSAKDAEATREAAQKKAPTIAKAAEQQGHDPVAYLEALREQINAEIAILKAKKGEPAH